MGKTIQDNSNPVWNHTANIEVDKAEGDLTFVVYDSDEGDVFEAIVKREVDNDFIGKVTLPLASTNAEFDLAEPAAPPKGKVARKKPGKFDTALKLKMVVEGEGCCGACSIM